MILGANAGKLAAITAAEAARMTAGGDPKYESIKRLIGPAGADVIDVFFLIDPRMSWPKAIELARRPVVVVVGDDPGGPLGQGGCLAWRCVARLQRWTRAAMVHAAAAQPEHYAECVHVATKLGRATLVETTSSNAEDWVAALRCRRTLAILPRAGVHPFKAAGAAQ